MIDAAKSCYAADYNSQLNTPEDITKNKIHSTITAATIVAMVREVKQDNGIKTIPIILTVSTEHQKETVRDLAKDANLGAKNTITKMFLKQKADVDTFIRGLPEIVGTTPPTSGTQPSGAGCPWRQRLKSSWRK